MNLLRDRQESRSATCDTDIEGTTCHIPMVFLLRSHQDGSYRNPAIDLRSLAIYDCVPHIGLGDDLEGKSPSAASSQFNRMADVNLRRSLRVCWCSGTAVCRTSLHTSNPSILSAEFQSRICRTIRSGLLA